MKRICFVLFVLLVSGTLFSQSLPTEKLVFVGSYNMSGLMTQFAQITIQSQPVKTSKKTYLHYSLTATTYSKWDSFFKIRRLAAPFDRVDYIRLSAEREILLRLFANSHP